MKRILLFAILTAFIFGCTASLPQEINFNEQAAQIVTHVTEGPISPGSAIRARFNMQLDTNSHIPENLFIIEPSISGTYSYEGSDTIVFTPSSSLPERTRYKAVVQTKLISGTKEDIHVPFSFFVEGIELIDSEISALSNDKKSHYTVEGQLTFNMHKPIDQIASAASLRANGQDYQLEWTEGTENTVYFSSASIPRPETTEDVQLIVNASSLGLKNDLELHSKVFPEGTFGLISVKESTDSKNPGLVLEFNEEIAENQIIDGLISASGVQNIKTSRNGNKVYLSGSFKAGQDYTVEVAKGIRSKFENKIPEQTRSNVSTGDIKPTISFLQSGVYLTSLANEEIYFKSTNLRRVHIEVKRVFENNLGQFLQTQRLNSAADRRDSFDYNEMNRVGLTVVSKTLTISDEKNKEIVSRLDLSDLIQDRDQGLYTISLTFKKDDMIWDFDRYYDSYYDDPSGGGYVHRHGKAYKPIALSDIGLTYKSASDKKYVFVTNLLNTEAVRDAKVSLMTYQNQVITSGKTNSQGVVEFDESADPFYIIAEKNNFRAVVKPNEMSWNISTFNTGGVTSKAGGLRGFFYTERGVHRPGDTVYLNAIIRNQDNSFPDNHPIDLKIINPKGQVFLEKTVNDGIGGFYHLPFSTSESDPTGTWVAQIKAADAVFTKNLMIETVVPNRLKVEMTTTDYALDPDESSVPVSLASKFLFGAPSPGLKVQIDVAVSAAQKYFAGFPGYSFNDPSVRFSTQTRNLVNSRLDEAGNSKATYRIPQYEKLPPVLNMMFEGRVTEDGGRSTTGYLRVSRDSYNSYVGINVPEFHYGYAKVDEELQIPVVRVDREGNIENNSRVEYTLYHQDSYWWWEYDSYNDFRARFKESRYTRRVKSGQVVINGRDTNVKVTPEEWGYYYLEVKDRESGHTAGFFFYASYWSRGVMSEEGGESYLGVRTDKKKYAPGDTATVTALTPANAVMLVTIEKNNRILSHRWVETVEGETMISIPITEEMLPNAYASVSLIQRYDQTDNDRPFRMYGIVPLMVEDPKTREELEINTSEVLRPGEDFLVQVKGEPNSQFTLAVVDEGLLDLTQFKTPKPWDYFFKKEALQVSTYDMYSHVIGAAQEDAFRSFSIGGGGYEDEAAGEDSESKRFKPVVLHSGIQKLDSKGRGFVSFSMPNYMGSVRMMAISANNNRYGTTEETVPVKSEIVLLPTLPRVLGPNETFKLPISLFGLDESIDDIKVKVLIEGPMKVIGMNEQIVKIPVSRQNEAAFYIKTFKEIGKAKVTIIASSGKFESTSETHIEIRPSSPPIPMTERQRLRGGQDYAFDLPAEYMPGSITGAISIQPYSEIQLDKRLSYLIRYPYGCIEQTTSSVFPQLFLDMFMDSQRVSQIPHNIRAGLSRLNRFQTSSGGFAYWPGGRDPSEWGTNYAGHFMLSAKKLGYEVPESMLSNWIRYQTSKAGNGSDNLAYQTYRLYLLALAGEPHIGAMNILKDDKLSSMTDVEKWMLAAAYKLSGMTNAARRIMNSAGTTVPEYNDFGGSYGSRLRDLAMILDAALILDNDKVQDRVFEIIAQRLNTEDWYSTQTLGYSLMAVGKFIRNYGLQDGQSYSGTITFADGSKERFSSSEYLYKYEIPTEKFEKLPLVVELNNVGDFNTVNVIAEWEGVPLTPIGYEIDDNIKLDVSYFNEDGRSMDSDSIPQGEEFYAVLTVSRTDGFRNRMDEMSLSYLLPSGWEVVNTRLMNSALPRWATSRYNFATPEYMDIRDDRAYWFWDWSYGTRQYQFILKMQAVTEGIFFQPASEAGAMYRRDYLSIRDGRRVRVTAQED